MPDLAQELANNYAAFNDRWKAELSSTETALALHSPQYVESYKRLASLNAWREIVIKNAVNDDVFQFFCEAHNDAVSSHVFASLGSWRAALKSLRSCIENTMFCQYYKDHPVEMRLWLQGKHRPAFSEIFNYFQKHPDIENLQNDLAGMQGLKTEYETLSRAVHASSSSFRMTSPGGVTNLWSADHIKLNSWLSRERRTITSLNLFLMALNSQALQGAAFPGLRQSISIVIGNRNMRRIIRSNLGINLDI